MWPFTGTPLSHQSAPHVLHVHSNEPGLPGSLRACTLPCKRVYIQSSDSNMGHGSWGEEGRASCSWFLLTETLSVKKWRPTPHRSLVLLPSLRGWWAFSRCSKQRLRITAARGLLIVVASLAVEHGLLARGLTSCSQGAWLPLSKCDIPTKHQNCVPCISRQILNH